MSLPEFALRVVDGGNVPSSLRLPMAGKMLESHGDMVLVNQRAPPLEPVHRGHTHTRHKVGVFPVALFGAPPTRIAGKVEHGRENLPRPPAAGLKG